MEQFSPHHLGKILIFLGALVALFGVILVFSAKIPFIGRLPGDIFIRRGNFIFYFPLATLIILNLFVFIIAYLLRK